MIVYSNNEHTIGMLHLYLQLIILHQPNLVTDLQTGVT